jgi:acetate kinase
MMGTRSGSIDPGILLHVLRGGIEATELADSLAHRSGLAAIAGVADAREIDRRADGGDERARLALNMFARRAAGAIASAATALPGLDGIVFTGGIGEHSASVRNDVVQRLRALMPSAQRLHAVAGDGVAADGPPAVLVVAAREDLVIADEVAERAH